MAANVGQGTSKQATVQVNGTTSGAVQIVATASTTGTRTQTLQDASGILALLSQNQTWTGAQDFTGATATFKDGASFKVVNSTDATKIAELSCASITTGTTRTYTFQDLNGTIALLEATQTFTAPNTFSSTSATAVSVAGGVNVNTGNAAANVGNFPVWTKVTIPYTSFSTAATTNSITLLSLVAGGIIHGVKIKHSTAFAGTGITAMTVSVGVTGTVNKYASPFDVFQAVSNTTFQLSNVVGSENHGAATTILITGTSTGGNLSALTQGSVDVWVLMSKAV